MGIEQPASRNILLFTGVTLHGACRFPLLAMALTASMWFDLETVHAMPSAIPLESVTASVVEPFAEDILEPDPDFICEADLADGPFTEFVTIPDQSPSEESESEVSFEDEPEEAAALAAIGSDELREAAYRKALQTIKERGNDALFLFSVLDGGYFAELPFAQGQALTDVDYEDLRRAALRRMLRRPAILSQVRSHFTSYTNLETAREFARNMRFMFLGSDFPLYRRIQLACLPELSQIAVLSALRQLVSEGNVISPNSPEVRNELSEFVAQLSGLLRHGTPAAQSATWNLLSEIAWDRSARENALFLWRVLDSYSNARRLLRQAVIANLRGPDPRPEALSVLVLVKDGETNLLAYEALENPDYLFRLHAAYYFDIVGPGPVSNVSQVVDRLIAVAREEAGGGGGGARVRAKVALAVWASIFIEQSGSGSAEIEQMLRAIWDGQSYNLTLSTLSSRFNVAAAERFLRPLHPEASAYPNRDPEIYVRTYVSLSRAILSEMDDQDAIVVIFSLFNGNLAEVAWVFDSEFGNITWIGFAPWSLRIWNFYRDVVMDLSLDEVQQSEFIPMRQQLITILDEAIEHTLM